MGVWGARKKMQIDNQKFREKPYFCRPFKGGTLKLSNEETTNNIEETVEIVSAENTEVTSVPENSPVAEEPVVSEPGLRYTSASEHASNSCSIRPASTMNSALLDCIVTNLEVSPERPGRRPPWLPGYLRYETVAIPRYCTTTTIATKAADQPHLISQGRIA